MRKLKPWPKGYTPPTVWDLAIENVEKGAHLVTAVLNAVYTLWDEPVDRRTGVVTGIVYEITAPEISALNVVRKLEGAKVGEDWFASYTVEQAVAALEKAKALAP